MNTSVSSLSKHLISASNTSTTTRQPFFRPLKGWVYGKKRSQPCTITWNGQFTLSSYSPAPDTQNSFHQQVRSCPTFIPRRKLQKAFQKLTKGKTPFLLCPEKNGQGYELYLSNEGTVLSRHFDCRRGGMENCDPAIFLNLTCFIKHTRRNLGSTELLKPQ